MPWSWPMPWLVPWPWLVPCACEFICAYDIAMQWLKCSCSSCAAMAFSSSEDDNVSQFAKTGNVEALWEEKQREMQEEEMQEEEECRKRRMLRRMASHLVQMNEVGKS